MAARMHCVQPCAAQGFHANEDPHALVGLITCQLGKQPPPHTILGACEKEVGARIVNSQTDMSEQCCDDCDWNVRLRSFASIAPVVGEVHSSGMTGIGLRPPTKVAPSQSFREEPLATEKLVLVPRFFQDSAYRLCSLGETNLRDSQDRHGLCRAHQNDCVELSGASSG